MIRVRAFYLVIFGLGMPAYAQSWHDLPNAPVTSRHNDVYFISPDTGWVVSGGAAIHRTNDGGETWELQFFKEAAHLRSVGFLNAERGFAGNVGLEQFGTTDPNPLYETSDGGATWTPVPAFHGRTPTGLCGMYVVNDTTVVAVGRVRGPAFFIKTSDGGRTWKSKDMSAYAAGLIDVYFPHPDTGFAVGLTNEDHNRSSGVVLATTDGGETWETRFKTSRTGEWCWKLSFPSRRVAYASLQRNTQSPIYFLKTTDGGVTWQEKLFSQSHYLVQGIGFITETTGWIGGNSTQPAYETRDGGETWSPLEIGTRLNRFRFLGDTLGYAAGRTVHKLTSPGQTGIADRERPLEFLQEVVHPNPFHSEATLAYTLAGPADVRIEIYDVSGKLVELVLDAILSPGRHEARWNAGTSTAAGVYFWVIRVGGIARAVPVVLLR